MQKKNPFHKMYPKQKKLSQQMEKFRIKNRTKEYSLLCSHYFGFVFCVWFEYEMKHLFIILYNF